MLKAINDVSFWGSDISENVANWIARRYKHYIEIKRYFLLNLAWLYDKYRKVR